MSSARRRLRGRRAENFQGTDGRRVTAFNAKLGKEVAEMTLHGGLHRPKQNGDVAVALALSDPEEDFGFAFRQAELFERLWRTEIRIETTGIADFLFQAPLMRALAIK